MDRDGVFDKHDVKPSLVADELREILFSEDGLWFVSRHLIGNTRLIERIHKPMLKWAQRVMSTPDAFGALRDPRMSGKSDGFTVAFPFWAWAVEKISGSPIQGVNTCIALVAPRADIARYVFVANVMDRYEKAEAYRELCPWVVADKKSWSQKNGLKLKRPLMHGLPSLYPLGMESVSTSLHPQIVIIDDPINEQNYRSRTEIARVNSYIQHSHSLTGPAHGVRMVVGNYWAVGDPQDQIHPEAEDCPQEFKKAHVWERGITGCETCVEGERFITPAGGSISGRLPDHKHDGLIFPVALEHPKMADNPDGPEIEEPSSYIEEVRSAKPTFIFLTQHENILVDPATLVFQKENLRYWDWCYLNNGEPALEVSVEVKHGVEEVRKGNQLFVNRHKHGGTREIIPLDHLWMYILVDPAPTEEATKGRSQFAAALIGCEKTTPRVFLIDEYATNAPEHIHINHLLDWYLRWRPWFKKFGIESVGYQKTIKDTLLTTAVGRGIHTLRDSEIEMLTRLKSEGHQKDRIRYNLTPMFELKQFYTNYAHKIFRAQHDRFGLENAPHDLLDAISNLLRIRSTPGRKGGSAMDIARKARERRKSAGVAGY